MTDMDSYPEPITRFQTDDRSALVRYPFPLRPGVLVYLYLPPDLTCAEVAKLGAFMETLVMEAVRAKIAAKV